MKENILVFNANVIIPHEFPAMRTAHAPPPVAPIQIQSPPPLLKVAVALLWSLNECWQCWHDFNFKQKSTQRPGFINSVGDLAKNAKTCLTPQQFQILKIRSWCPLAAMEASPIIAEFRWIIFVDQYRWSSMSILSFLLPTGFLHIVRLFNNCLNLVMKPKPHLV